MCRSGEWVSHVEGAGERREGRRHWHGRIHAILPGRDGAADRRRRERRYCGTGEWDGAPFAGRAGDAACLTQLRPVCGFSTITVRFLVL